MNIKKFDDFFDENITLAKLENHSIAIIASNNEELRCNVYIPNPTHALFVMRNIMKSAKLSPQEVMYALYQEEMEN
jgi:hypothetical protein